MVFEECMNVFTVSILNEEENGNVFYRPDLKTNVKSDIYWSETGSGSIWRTGWHTHTVWDLILILIFLCSPTP